MTHGEFTAVMIVAIVMFASIIRARYGYGRHRRRDGPVIAPQEQAETLRLRDEVKELKERLKRGGPRQVPWIVGVKLLPPVGRVNPAELERLPREG